MQRRNFLQTTALCAVAVSTTGFVHFDGHAYAGDCETTTDILGPFYRPDAPQRNNLIVRGVKGMEVLLRGTVRHKDCTTPYKNAKVELWHCSPDGVYDNTSDEYRFRGTVYCDEQGRYQFLTILPVPYDQGNGQMRPAHFHLLVSAPGYQSLITQLYFTGDPHLKTDEQAASPTARRRILDMGSSADGRKEVVFEVVMTDNLMVEPAVLDRLAGTYVDEKDEKLKTEFFRRDHQLWRKAGTIVYGINLDYIGNNTFSQGGLAPGRSRTYLFEPQEGGAVKMTQTTVEPKAGTMVSVAYRKPEAALKR
ncbi:dioxygenase family protein [Larkinella soli]|uniref:dioxygenase family protein n=1 Tax=Larkinella soli TaxID=1770527 RepID=UPI0013E31ED8|nr:catechol 1,2-dioxygenase [Larkinella soli]